MRLLIITQYFSPEMGAPQARLLELAMRLRDRGHAITVLTAMPNYPTGRVFDGYRGKLRCVEDIDGIKVIRTALFPSKSSRLLPRLACYLTFAASSLLFGLWKLGRHDVAIIESPPLFILPSALVISRITRARPVMMVSDIWPDVLLRMGYSARSFGVRSMLWLERFSYDHCAAVALTNPGAMRQIRERFPQLNNVTIVSNGVDTRLFRPELRSESLRKELGASDDTLLVGYCGLHGMAQGLEVINHAAEFLRRRENVKFVMIGEGPTRDGLSEWAREKGLTNIAYYARRPKEQMPALLASLDVSLVPLAARLPGTMPSKIYEALASGAVPVVAKGCEGEPLVTDHFAGETYEPGSPRDMADAIERLATDRGRYAQMRENAFRLSKRFDREKIAGQTERILMAIAGDELLPEISW